MKLLIGKWAQNSERNFADLFDGKGSAVYLFEGGTDVSPRLYGEDFHPQTQFPDTRRDVEESRLFKQAVASNAPMIGICRGSQFLTVMNGGKLHQHVPGTPYIHEVETYDGQFFPVTSTHHQVMRPETAPDYSIKAWDIFTKGPEIVWYPETKSLCIQGHPEYLERGHPFVEYTRLLISNLILKGDDV